MLSRICFTALTLLAFWAGTVTSVSASDETYTMRIGYSTKGDPMEIQSYNFRDKLKARVGDRIKVEIYPSAQLGSNETMIQHVQQGSLQAVINPPAFVAGRHPLLHLFDLPYFIELDSSSAIDFFNGPIAKKVFAGLEAKGLVNLRSFPGGERLLVANFDVDSNSIAPLKGKKIRVMPSKVPMDTWASWGATGVPMNVPEIYTALQQKTIDGVDCGSVFGYTWKYHKVAKNLYMVPNIPCCTVFLASKKWLESLPEDLRKAVYDAISDDKEAALEGIKMSDDSVKNMEKEGIKIVHPSESLVKELREKSKAVHKKFLAENPEAQPLYDEISRAINK